MRASRRTPSFVSALGAALLCVAPVALAACGGGETPADEAVHATTEGHEIPAAPEPPEAHATQVDAAQVRTLGAGLPALPVGLTSFGLAAHDDAVYLLGGYFGRPHDYRAEHQSPTLYVLPAGASAWQELDALERGMQSVALVTVTRDRTRLHRVGGMQVRDGEGMFSVAEHAAYDPARGTWTELPPLPEPRSSHDAIAHGADLYVAGGWNLAGSPRHSEFATTLLRFDGERWHATESPLRRRAFGLAATTHHLVAIGGLGEDGVSQGVDVFDTRNGEWTEGPAFPGTRTGFGVAALGIGEDVFASSHDGVVRRWRVGSDAWEDVGVLAFPRFFHRMVPNGDGVAVVGGIGGMHTFGRTRVVERFVPGQRFEPVVVAFPFPGQTRNRQGVALDGDHLSFFGGNVSLGQHDFQPEHFAAEAWRVHLPSLAYDARAAYPVRRQSMTTVVLPGDQANPADVLSVAGFGHEVPGGGALPEDSVARTQAGILRYSGAEDAWAPFASLPVARSQIGTFVHDGTLYVLGGLDYDASREEGDQFRHLTEIVAMPLAAADRDQDDSHGPFRTLEVALPGPRRAFGGALLGDRYYLVGGMKEGFQLVDDCFAFDVPAQRFEPIACPARTRLNPRLVAVGQQLVLVGGTTELDDGSLGEDRSVEIYDPATNTWSVAPFELPFTPKHANAFAYGERLLVSSTHDEDGMLRLAFLPL